MVRDTGFEPVTPSVSGRCSTTELTARVYPPKGSWIMRLGPGTCKAFFEGAGYFFEGRKKGGEPELPAV